MAFKKLRTNNWRVQLEDWLDNIRPEYYRLFYCNSQRQPIEYVVRHPFDAPTSIMLSWVFSKLDDREIWEEHSDEASIWMTEQEFRASLPCGEFVIVPDYSIETTIS